MHHKQLLNKYLHRDGQTANRKRGINLKYHTADVQVTLRKLSSHCVCMFEGFIDGSLSNQMTRFNHAEP